MVFVVMLMRETRVITGFKNMADYHEGHTLKACEKSKTKTRTNTTRLQETLEKRYMLEKGRDARKNNSGSKHKTGLLILLFFL